MPETPFRASRARKSNRKLTRANTTVSQSPGPHTNGPVAASKTAEDLERSRTSNLPSGSGRYSTALEDFNLNAYRDVLSDVETDPSAPPLTPARNGQFDSLLDDDNEVRLCAQYSCQSLAFLCSLLSCLALLRSFCHVLYLADSLYYYFYFFVRFTYCFFDESFAVQFFLKVTSPSTFNNWQLILSCVIYCRQ